MPNGQQLKVENYKKFLEWMKGKTDNDYRQLESRGLINRSEIAREIGFAKSVLAQNPDVKKALLSLEERLREKGILPPLAASINVESPDPPLRASGTQRDLLDQERLKRLEETVAALRAERDMWRERCAQYEMLDRALSASGRLPR